jgi:hypothetical protein
MFGAKTLERILDLLRQCFTYVGKHKVGHIHTLLDHVTGPKISSPAQGSLISGFNKILVAQIHRE